MLVGLTSKKILFAVSSQSSVRDLLPAQPMTTPQASPHIPLPAHNLAPPCSDRVSDLAPDGMRAVHLRTNRNGNGRGPRRSAKKENSALDAYSYRVCTLRRQLRQHRRGSFWNG